MTRLDKAPGKRLRDLRHGGQVVDDDAPQAKELSAVRERISLLSSVIPGDDAEQATTPFDYLFDDLAAQFPARHGISQPARLGKYCMGETIDRRRSSRIKKGAPERRPLSLGDRR